ncbi:MAG: HNH endonuclease [Deltaproteobacteria bacterium]|nr:HNH endonuclease [Deltaproteobacteria bacterium]
MQKKCRKCGDNLFGKPKINIGGEIFCYKCSKDEVVLREQSLLEKAKINYEHEFEIYSRAKAKHDNEYSDWWQKRREYAGSIGNYGCGFSIGATVVLWILFNEIQKGLGFIGVIIAIIIFIIFVDIEKRRYAKFEASYPEPKFVQPHPTLNPITPIDHFPHDHNGSSLAKKDYRDEIIRRDNLTCQICGQKKRKNNLEVHHIIPQSKGGSDDPTNLITLCKFCHDREDWYEHIRKYPTTIKPSRHWRRRKFK